MSWIKISDDNGGVWAEEASPDPQRIVIISELEAEITKLQGAIDAIVFMDYPENADDDLKMAVDIVNENKRKQINETLNQKQVKQIILEEINVSSNI